MLGTPDDTARNHNGHSATTGYIIDFCRKQSGHCWGSNALDHVAGGAEGAFHTKAINLARVGLDDNDMGNLFYVLRDFNFNLDIINVPGNNFGNPGVVSMINGITGLNHQTLYKAPEWKPYAATFNTVQNVTVLNLANNNIGDAGAKTIADAIVSGKLKATTAINISDNEGITKVGEGYLVKALQSIHQSVSIALVKTQELSKDALKAAMKSMLFIAKSNGITTKEIVTNDETIEFCKKGAWNVTKNIIWGGITCNTKIGKAVTISDLNIGSLVKDVVVEVINPLKKPAAFVCVMEETIFSVVDEDFSNCLVGVDSLLN